MANTEAFSVLHTAGKTVFAYFMRAADGYILDKSGKKWKVNLAACTQAKWQATERTDLGDADESLYAISFDLMDLRDRNPKQEFLIQWVDDLATDEIIDTESFWVGYGKWARAC